MSFFNQLDSTIKKENFQNRVENPLLFKRGQNPQITILIDELIGKDLLNKFTQTIKNRIGEFDYQILYCVKFKINNKTIEKEIVGTYFDNRIDLQKYIPANSKIITIGRSIYSIAGNKDIDTKTFYDFITNDTYFYAPEIKSYVFPVGMFFKWIDKDNFDRWFAFSQIKKALEFEIPHIRERVINKIFLEDPNSFFEENQNNFKKMAIDTETSSLNFMRGEIGCVTFSFDGVTGYYARWKDINKKMFNDFINDKYQIYANGKFDVKFFWKVGISNARIDYDTLNAGHCLNEMRSNSLKTHAWIYTRYGGYEKTLEDFIKKYKKTDNYLEISESILFEYATMDAIITFQVYEKMKIQMDEISNRIKADNGKWDLNRYYFNVVLPSVRMFSEIEYKGLYIDWKKVADITDIVKKDLEKAQEDVLNLIGKQRDKINLDSLKQLGASLKEIGLPSAGLSKAGDYLVNDNSTAFWKKNGHPETECIEKMNSIKVILNGFLGESFLSYRDSDNKIRPSFHVMLARSGRNRSSEPNFQNIPKTGKYAKLIRSCYVPPSDDYYICEFDAAGFQLRIGTALSNDVMMKKVFTELGGDMHSMTAQSLWFKDMSLEEFIENKNKYPYKQYRQKAKIVNFSLEFGSGALKFTENAIANEWTDEETDEYLKKNNLLSQVQQNKESLSKFYKTFEKLDKFAKWYTVGKHVRSSFFQTYYGLEKWINKSISKAKEKGYVISSFGCIRRLPQLLYSGNDEDGGETKNMYNIAVNSPVQNFEAVVINSTMVELHNYIKQNNLKSQIIGTVHDAIILYVYKDELKIITQKIKEFFEKDRPENNGIPLEIEGEKADYTKGEVWAFGSSI